MAIFGNPNFPVQPQRGVYGWYAHMNGKETIAIYIGMAGQKESFLPKGTLFRGISELQRNTFTSNSPNYNALDTDFIVGTAILFFEMNGYSCVWKHLSNEPKEEFKFVNNEKPILQNTNNTKIKDEFRIKRDQKGYWDARKNQEGVKEAERAIFSALEKADWRGKR